MVHINYFKTKAITVEGSYELLNGFVDLQRDIVMKLVKIVENDDKIKNIVGMGLIFYYWSKKEFFRWARKAGRYYAVLQSFAYSKPLSSFGYEVKKFIPMGRKWTRISVAVWRLEQDDRTYEITASSVWTDDDVGHAPHNLFDGESERDWGYNVWAAKVNRGELVLKLNKAELFHCICLESRKDPANNQAPHSFNILGSNGGEAYDVLGQYVSGSGERSASVSGSVGGNAVAVWGSREARMYPLIAKRAYTHYKIEFLGSNSPFSVSLAQLNFGILKAL